MIHNFVDYTKILIVICMFWKLLLTVSSKELLLNQQFLFNFYISPVLQEHLSYFRNIEKDGAKYLFESFHWLLLTCWRDSIPWSNWSHLAFRVAFSSTLCVSGLWLEKCQRCTDEIQSTSNLRYKSSWKNGVFYELR